MGDDSEDQMAVTNRKAEPAVRPLDADEIAETQRVELKTPPHTGVEQLNVEIGARASVLAAARADDFGRHEMGHPNFHRAAPRGWIPPPQQAGGAVVERDLREVG